MKVLKVMLGVVLGGLILFGGCALLVGGALDQAAEEDSRPGRADNPLEIHEGEPFEVDGFNYAPGWKLKNDALGDMAVKGLRVTNNRDEKDSALVEIKVWRGDEIVALADCTTEPIQPGTTTRLNCLSTDHLPRKYDRLTINDTF